MFRILQRHPKTKYSVNAPILMHIKFEKIFIHEKKYVFEQMLSTHSVHNVHIFRCQIPKCPEYIWYYLLSAFCLLLFAIRLLHFFVQIYTAKCSFGHDFIQNASDIQRTNQMNTVHVLYSFWIHNAFVYTNSEEEKKIDERRKA